jgi:hypothetical protein
MRAVSLCGGDEKCTWNLNDEVSRDEIISG